jgi:hypothetical protein
MKINSRMLSSFFRFSNEYYSMKDFSEIKVWLQPRIGRTVQLGVIRKNQIFVYYDKNLLSELGISQIPLIKIEILNEKDTNGLTRIKFRYSRMVMVLPLFVLFGGAGISYLSSQVTVLHVLGSLVILHFGLRFEFQTQARRFKKDFQEMLVADSKINADFYE